MSAVTSTKKSTIMVDPPIARSLFGDVRWSWLWLIIRLYIGYEWFSAGFEKIANPAWMSGAALKGFWTAAVAVPAAPARAAISFGWYRAFIQSLLDAGSYTWFSKFVVVGEIVIGAALILGLFTGIAAFFGGFMNFNYMLAGTASTNPVLFILAIVLIMAWKTAGWIGLDHWILPALGTPWQPGKVFNKPE
jgi:thiosulfate dehydrogenase (quinone) large subunit